MTEEEIVALAKISGLALAWEVDEEWLPRSVRWGCSIRGDTIPHGFINRYAATREAATQGAWDAYLRLRKYQEGS